MKTSKITLRINEGLNAYLTGASEVFSALLGRNVSKTEVLIRLAEGGKASMDNLLANSIQFEAKEDNDYWTNS